MAIKKTSSTEPLHVEKLKRNFTTVFVLGTTPLVMNRLSKKAKEELLLPRRTMNKAARAQTQKHNPPEEFRDSIYRCRDLGAPTLLHIPNGAFKKSMASAALDMEGATKAQIGRLVQITDATVHIYGVPYLYMEPVRLAGIVKTPDIRTRAKLPQWCCKFEIKYVGNQIRQQDIVNLMDAAGDIVGVGDGRTEKGTYNNGQWRLCEPDDKEWHAIANKQARKAQQAAMDNPTAVDEETEELLSWYYAEILRREQDQPITRAAPGAVVKPKRGAGRARLGAEA